MVYLIVAVPYLILVLLFYLKWNSISQPVANKTPAPRLKLSVVIPVRNEAKNISNLLLDLNNQSLPSENFEVIVINDSSEDDTVSLVEKTQPRLRFELILEQLGDHSGSTKKAAITQAVSIASGNIIVMTDGDCRLNRDWLASIERCFRSNDTKLAFGSVRYSNADTIFTSMQSAEMAALIGTGAASLHLGVPNMCNGANIAFDKQAFYEAGGFSGVEDVVSGDDEFLMHRIYQLYPYAVHFIKDPSNVVSTVAHESLSHFIQQRRRWASKWSFYQQWRTKLLAAFIFAFHLVTIIFLGLTVAGFYSIAYFLWVLTFKMIIEFLLIRSVMHFNKQRPRLTDFLLLQLLYPFYVVAIAAISQFGKFSWKGRVYRA